MLPGSHCDTYDNHECMLVVLLGSCLYFFSIAKIGWERNFQIVWTVLTLENAYDMVDLPLTGIIT